MAVWRIAGTSIKRVRSFQHSFPARAGDERFGWRALLGAASSLSAVQKQAETACPLGEQESTGGGRRRRQGGGRRVCTLLWVLGWEGWDPCVFTLPSTSQAEPSCRSGTVESKSTEHPTNPQRGHRAGLLSLAGPELPVMPIKSLGAQHGARLWQSCCLAPWPPFPTANETGPQERSQGRPWAQWEWRRLLRRPLALHSDTDVGKGSWKLGTIFH